MNVFDEIDSMSLLEDHAQELLELEEREAKTILDLYRRVAVRMRRRLASSKPDSFTEQQIRVVLSQIEAGISVLSADLNEVLPGTIDRVAGKSAVHLATEAEVMEKRFMGSLQRVNLDAVRVASHAKNLLINRYQASINAYSNKLRTDISMGLREMVAENLAYDAVVRRMLGFWGNEEWRLRRIVRTELHNVYGQSKLFGMRDLRGGMFPDLKKTLYHPMDRRTAEDSRYVSSRELVTDVDLPFRYQWPPGSGRWRTFMAPPDRPNDRSILIPYRPVWSE